MSGEDNRNKSLTNGDCENNSYSIAIKDNGIKIYANGRPVLFFTREHFSEIFNTILFQTGLYKKPEGYNDTSPWITTKKPKPKDLYPRHT